MALATALNGLTSRRRSCIYQSRRPHSITNTPASYRHKPRQQPVMTASLTSASTESIILDKVGSSQYRKLSYPLHCGVFTELACEEAVLHFNGNGEILRAKRARKRLASPQ
jgi:hypothetical protein